MAQVLAVLLTIALVGLAFYATRYFRDRGQASAAPGTVSKLEQPGAPATSSHPLAKFLEVTGIRLTEEKGRRFARVLVVNHSSASLPDMQLRIYIKAANREITDFPVTLSSLAPYETRDLATEVKVGLKPYEMPDWNMTQATFDITSRP